MRGRKPRPLEIVPHDVPILQEIARSRSLPWYQIQRARIVLGVAAGEPIQLLAIQTQCDPSTIWRICRRYESSGLPGLLGPPQRTGRRPGFPPLQRAQIVRLACLEPIAKGLHITHWTSRDLARQAVEDGIVPAISDRTVRTILDEVDLQPHRTRYWRTARVDAEFKARPRRSFGATRTPSGWLGGASGWSAPMRSPTSRSWSGIRSGDRSPARSSSGSSSIPGTARSTSWSS